MRRDVHEGFRGAVRTIEAIPSKILDSWCPRPFSNGSAHRNLRPTALAARGRIPSIPLPDTAAAALALWAGRKWWSTILVRKFTDGGGTLGNSCRIWGGDGRTVWPGEKIFEGLEMTGEHMSIRERMRATNIQPDIVPLLRWCGDLHLPLGGRNNDTVLVQPWRHGVGVQN